tara:strand:- start:1170 stop:1802 length:633 start_codon:yes stop_codon:yes gene_type:complete
MLKDEYFRTPVWSEDKTEFVKSLNKACNKYIKKARTRDKKNIQTTKDFGTSHHSPPLLKDNDFIDFRKYVGQKSWEFLEEHGYNMKSYTTLFSEMWVQEFSQKGGGHHTAHIHGNQHVAGLYFLKASEKTSYPIFYDPRTGARATNLNLDRSLKGIYHGTDVIHYKAAPGRLIIFPGYLEHGFSVDPGIEPFRFIHWNIMAVPKGIVKDA